MTKPSGRDGAAKPAPETELVLIDHERTVPQKAASGCSHVRFREKLEESALTEIGAQSGQSPSYVHHSGQRTLRGIRVAAHTSRCSS